MSEKLLPFYKDVDGFRIPGIFSSEVFRSGLTYKPIPEDLFVVAFPKSGSTWLQQIVTLIYTGVSVNDYFEFNMLTPFLDMCGVEGVDKLKRPGAIKTHVPFHLAPYSPNAKYISLVRNPKDLAVSFFYHTRSYLYRYENGKFDDYFELFINGETDYGDQIDHVLSWYEHRNDDNVLFITYEELKRDTKNMVKKIAKFMGDKYGEMLEDEEKLDMVLKYSSVEHMKTMFNDAFDPDSAKSNRQDIDPELIPAGLKYFNDRKAEYKVNAEDKFTLIRKAIIGDWRSMFSVDQNRRMNHKIELKLKGTDIYEYWKSIDCI